MTHPSPPLSLEERVELVTSSSDPITIFRIQKHFAQRRDAEFPGWRETYEREIQQWLSWQKQPKRERS